MASSLFQFSQLQSNSDIVHFFTQKPYNFHPDLPSSERSQQLNKIFAQIHYTPNIILNGTQSHSAHVQIITQANLNTFNPIKTDGLITNLPDVALTTYVADCQAILLYDPIHQVIANLHSGWRGTLQKIAQTAITQMAQVFQSQPRDIQAYICPSIQNCCFEISPEVIREFRSAFTDLTPYLRPSSEHPEQKFYLDTVRINCDLLKSLGLTTNHIFANNICTKCQSNTYHSYRASGEASGRNLAFICLKPS